MRSHPVCVCVCRQEDLGWRYCEIATMMYSLERLETRALALMPLEIRPSSTLSLWLTEAQSTIIQHHRVIRPSVPYHLRALAVVQAMAPVSVIGLFQGYELLFEMVCVFQKQALRTNTRS